MSKVAIVTDSTAYIPKEHVEEYGITVMPQVLIWGDETLLDGVDIQPEDFYARLKTAPVMPSTSQVTIQAFENTFKDLLDKGFDILAILISNELSGTINSAVQALEAYPNAPIEIVDSQTTAMALGFQVLAAARAVSQGASLQECKVLAEKAREHVGVVFAVDTLEFLHRGGRIGGGRRFLGSLLNVKPLLEVTGGRIEALEQVRTRKKSLDRLVEIVVERVGNKPPVRLATLHAYAEDDANYLLDSASKQLDPVETVFSEVSPVVGTHAGPGTVGLAYMAGM